MTNEIDNSKKAAEMIPEEDEPEEQDGIEEDADQRLDRTELIIDSTEDCVGSKETYLEKGKTDRNDNFLPVKHRRIGVDESAIVNTGFSQGNDSYCDEPSGEVDNLRPNEHEKTSNESYSDDDTSGNSTRHESTTDKDQKSADLADEMNGEAKRHESVQQTTSSVEVGLGEKKATLYLSRAASMVRTSKNVEISEDKTQSADEVAGPVVVQEENKDSVPQKASAETDTVPEPSISALSREFTFTGYDIMADEPIKKVKTKIELQREKASRLYRTTCHRLDIIPASYLCERLMDSTIKMKSHGLGPTGTKAVAIALVENFYIESLDLEDNAIGAEGARCLAQMLDDNTSITDLGIAENLIGSEGLAPIADIMSTNQFIARLDISGNGLDDDDAILLKQMLETNRYLLNLKASHNKFGEQGGVHIAKALAINESLQILDISWNHIRGKGAVALANGLKKNIGLKVLNVSWNGFAIDGCAALGRSLRVNTTLEELNLICNRIETTAVGPLINGVQRNTNLKILRGMVVDREFEQLATSIQERRPLKILIGASVRTSERLEGNDTGFSGMDPVKLQFEYTSREGLRIIDLFTSLDRDGSRSLGQNPMTPDVCLAVLKGIDKSTKTVLEVLDMEGMVVDREFEQLATSIQERRHLKILTGASVRTSERLEGNDTGFSGMDPVKLLFEYTSREGLRIIDLFTSLDRDGSRSVSHEEFREGLLSVDVPLTEDQIEQLIEKLDKDKDGEVDFSELIDGERAYKRKKLRIKLKKEELAKQKRRERAKARALEKLDQQEWEATKTASFKK